LEETKQIKGEKTHAYKLKTSGECDFPVIDKQECENAMEIFSVVTKINQEINQADKPYGCFFSSTLELNVESNSQTECTKDNICVCKNTIDVGKNAQSALEAQKCRDIASNVGIQFEERDFSKEKDSYDKYPCGCFYEEESFMFNNNADCNTNCRGSQYDIIDSSINGLSFDVHGISGARGCIGSGFDDVEIISRCQLCPLEFHWNSDTGICEPNVWLCPGGNAVSGRSKLMGDIKCITCNYGYGTIEENHQRCRKCEDEHYTTNDSPLSGTGSMCEQVSCDYGKGRGLQENFDELLELEDRANMLTCIDCAPGTFSDSEQTGQCQIVQPGYTVKMSFSHKMEEQVKCKPGTYSEGYDVVLSNNESPTFEDFMCKQCLSGKFAETEASSECKNCPKGWQNDALGQSHCTKILCNFGYVVSTANTCVKCPIGTWTTVESEGICDRIKCPTGSVNPTPPNTDRCRSDTKVMVGDNMYEIIGSVENININGNEVEINLNEVNEVTVFEHSFENSDKLCDSLSDEFPTELHAKEECFKKIDCIGIEKVLNKWKLCESVDASKTGGTILQIRTEKKHTLKPKIKYSMSSVQVGMYSEYKKLLDEKDELSNTLSGYNDILTENEKTKRIMLIGYKHFKYERNAHYQCDQAENELKRYTTLVSDATYGPVCTIDTIDDKTYVTLLSPPACQHVNGVEANDKMCSCGFVVCPNNNYCYSKYNQCHETKIEYVAKQNSQNCEGYEVSIDSKVQCDTAANTIGLCVSDCAQETETIGSDCWYDRGIHAQQEYSNVIYGAHTPDQLDLLLCKIKKCYCIHGTSANGCDGEQCTGCNDGYFLNQDSICEEHPKCIKQKTKEGTGTTTTKRICEPCNNNCENGGSLKDVEGCECQCVTGFSGDSCETPAPCTKVNNQDCVNGVTKGTFGNCYCECPQGYSGELCQNEPVCPICQNGGVSENCACNCINGFTGANCNECGIGKGKNAAGHCEDCTYPNYNSVTTHDAACAAQNCPDGQGVTSDSATWTTTGGCEPCGTGYESPAGKGQCTDINDCASSPCQNGATCADGVNSYSCACTAGYSGDNCENDLDNCKDDKTDVWVSEGDKNNSPYYDFYTTESCDTTKITTLSKTTTYTFRRCADATSHPFWIGLHGGQTGIIGTGQLTITTGTEDVTYKCTTHPAMNSALVVVDYNPKCKNEGVCADGVCTCTDGYSDSTCTTNDNDCLSEPCQNEATCIDGVDSYTCACVTGFSGPVCDVNIDDCHTNTCSGHGTCLDGVNSYTCECSDNWFGASCESQTNKCNGKVCNNVPITCTTIENECKCISGWHDKEGECEKNRCQCSGGEPVDECPQDNKNMCKSCTNGLLTDGNCINVCKCTNGVVADVCPQHDTNICKSCDEGFVKDESDQCVKSCVCDNGIAAEEDECPTNGAMKCKSCNTKYYLKNNMCHVHSSVCTSEQYQAQEPTGEQDRICKPNKCTCVHGGAATGIDCHVDGSLCTEEAPCNICAECNKGYQNHNNICIPHVCTCDGGIEKNLEGCDDYDDPRCCHPSGEYCLTCNEGYEMTGNECKTKCTCLNGLPYAGTECLDASAKCGSCNTGYNIENEVCVTACQCPNGVPFKGSECAITPEKCESCDVGFKEIQGATVTCETRCTCTNGEPSEGVCTQEDEHCKSCDSEFYLDDDNKCKQIVCTCANGQAHADCTNHGDEKCTSCDAGFRLDVNKCVATICTCADGTPVDNVDCNWPQTHLCASCHGGFKLDSNKHCLENICTCQNGTPARGSECGKDHEHCRYCDVGYEGSKIGEEMHCVVQNFRGDFEYHIVVPKITNTAQISQLMKVKTGFETTVVKHEFVNGKMKLHLLTRDNPIKNDGAFKTVKTLLSNTVDEFQNEPHIRNVGFFGKEKKESMGPIPVLIMWVVVVIILSAAIPACLIFRKKKIQSENATDSEREQLMHSKIEF
jgi:Notch-like protein